MNSASAHPPTDKGPLASVSGMEGKFCMDEEEIKSFSKKIMRK